MKLATYQDGSRDGQLVVVSSDLKQAHFANHIATRMQQLLDDWNFIAPQLEQLYRQLNQGKAPYPFAFEPERCMAPLPRPVSCTQSNAYDPVIHEGASLHLLCTNPNAIAAPHALLNSRNLMHSTDFTASLAVITGDIAQDCGSEQAIEGVRLLMLSSNISTGEDTCDKPQRDLVMVLFSPVAITLDELGDTWQQGRPALRVDVSFNEQPIAFCPANEAAAYAWGDVLHGASRHYSLGAGSIVDSGPVIHTDPTKGYTSILLKRLNEQRETGTMTTPYLQPGDRLRVEAKGKDGQSLFGSISLKFTPDA